MVKRVLAIILAIIISFTAVETTGLFFVSAIDGENTYCTHPDDKLVHIEANNPTCTKPGGKAYVLCKDCNCVISINGVDLETPATYEKVKDQIIVESDENAHVYDNLKRTRTDPTCTATGIYAYIQCSECNKYYKIISTDEDGVNTYKELTLNGDDVNPDDLVIPKIPHTWGEVTPKVPATCTKEGKEAFAQCSVCQTYAKVTGEDPNYEYEEVESEYALKIDKLDPNGNHTWNEAGIVAVKAATCEDSGISTSYTTCTKCGAYAKVTGNSGNYSYTECTVESDDTNEDGVIDENDFVAPALGHEYGTEEGVNCAAYNAPSCTKDGNYGWAMCTRCNKFYRTTDENGDTIDPYVEIANADAANLEAIEHDYTDLIPQKDATCTEPGLEAHYQCSVCGQYSDADETEVEYADLVIPATGHNYNDGIITKEATCTADGIKTFTCETCNDTYTEVIPAIGHDWDWTLQITKEPTCIAGGEGEITCKRCDKKEIVIIDKNPSAHKYKNDGICQLCGQKVLTQSGSNTTSKDTNKNNTKIVKIINSRNKTKVKIKKKKIIIKFSRRGGCKYRIKIYNKKNKEISLKVKQDYMKGNGKKKFKKFYQIKKKGDYRIEIYELKGMKEKNFKDVKCIYLNYKTIK